MGKMVWDVSRCIDYIETLRQVDSGRIGCIGHSHGAYGTIFAAAFDPRIACAAASCGFTTLRTDPRPDRWSHLTPLLPPIGFYVPDAAAADRPDRTRSASERPDRTRGASARPGGVHPARQAGETSAPQQAARSASERQDGTRSASERLDAVKDIPFDWHEICSLIAPRPFLNWATLGDSIFPNTDNLRWVFGQLGEVYDLCGAKGRLAWKLAPGEHRFPTEAREWAYGWLEEQLRE
jgi:hypothetical protein